MDSRLNRKEQIEEIKHVLVSDNKFYKPEEIENYLEKYNVTNAELFDIVNAMASENYIFRWLDYISAKISLFVDHKDFLILLKKIITKVKGDMAQGIFIRALISIGEQNPQQGIALYNQMIVNRDSDLIAYSSFPLGGAGKKNFALIYDFIKEGFENLSSERKAASLKTIRVANEKAENLQNADQIFELIDNGSMDKENLAVRLEATEAYLDLSPFMYDHCIKRLFLLAQSGNSEIRYTLARKLWLQDLKNKEDEFKILSVCAKDGNRNVLSSVSMALSRKGPAFPELSLNIIKYWVVSGKYSDVHDIDYAILEIGKGNLSRSIAEVVSWIRDRDDKKFLEFYIPIILKELSSSDYRTLLKSIEIWWAKDERHKKIAIETMRKVLTEIYPPNGDRIAIVDSYLSLPKYIAKKKNLNVETLISSESEKIFQGMLIIDELRGISKKLDFNLITKNLETYSDIRDFIGNRWFESFNNKNNINHPLLAILSSELNQGKLDATVTAFRVETNDFRKYMLSLKIRQIVSPIAYLSYLNEMIKSIASKCQKVKDLKNGLKNSKMFFATFSEIEAIYSFIQDYDVDIAPKLHGKKLDLKVGLNSGIYIEVISPDMFKPLKYLSGKEMGIRNRARGKILDELKHHFKDVDAVGNIPWVIIVDLSRSEISDDFIEDALMGSEQFTWFLNKETNEVIGQSFSRTNDSVHEIEGATDILSAIICYKTKLGNDGKFHREGKIVTNSHAKNPLSKELLEEIEKRFLR